MFPEISVVMSVYNTPDEWLKKSIDSILNQTYKNFEFIIVLDCPCESNVRIVESYQTNDDRIVVLKNKENCGLTKSLNRGLKIARGKYIARMDSDDISLPDRLQKQIQYMESKHNVVALGSYICMFGAKEQVEGRTYNDQEQFRIRMLFSNVGLPHPTSFIRASVLRDYKIEYDERIKKAQDYRLWTQIMKYGRIEEIKEPLLLYRIHENQISYVNRSGSSTKNEDAIVNNSQDYYASKVAKIQLSEVISDICDDDCDIHAYAISSSEYVFNDDVDALDSHFDRIIEGNEKYAIYNSRKLKREIKTLWCLKGLKRKKRLGKGDMLSKKYLYKYFTLYFVYEILYLRVENFIQKRIYKKMKPIILEHTQ